MLNLLSIFIFVAAFGLFFTSNSFILVFLLISIFFLIFILFLLSGVNFLALSFLIVYIGAVAILFLFAVMLLGQQTSNKDVFSINLKLFWFSFFLSILSLFFFRIYTFWFYNNNIKYNNTISFNSFFLDSNYNSLLNEKSNIIFNLNFLETKKIINTLVFKDSNIGKTQSFNNTLESLNFSLENDFIVFFNETLDFIQFNLKNEILLDIYAISSKLYEDFSLLFIVSGLLLLIAMLAVVGLIVPPKNKLMKN